MGEEKSASPKTGVNSAKENTTTNKRSSKRTSSTASAAATPAKHNIKSNSPEKKQQQKKVDENATTSSDSREEQNNATTTSPTAAAHNKNNKSTESILTVDTSSRSSSRRQSSSSSSSRRHSSRSNSSTNSEVVNEIAESNTADQTPKKETNEQTVEAKSKVDIETADAKEEPAAESEKKFALRIVPLEKLLAKPDKTTATKNPVRVLRERNAKNSSIIELSSSSEDNEDEGDCSLTSIPDNSTANAPSRSISVTKEKETVNTVPEATKEQITNEKEKEKLETTKQSKSSRTTKQPVESSEQEEEPQQSKKDDKKTEAIKRKPEDRSSDSDSIKGKNTRKRRAKEDSSDSEESANRTAATKTATTKESKLRNKQKSEIPNKRRTSRRQRSSTSSSELSVRATRGNTGATTDKSSLEQNENGSGNESLKKKKTSPKTSTIGSEFKVKRCVVRVQRSSLSAGVSGGTDKSTRSSKSKKPKTAAERKMNFGDAAAVEGSATTSNAKRKRNVSDSDSDYAVAANEEVATAATDSDDDAADAAAAESSSDSEVIPQRKKRGGPQKKNKKRSSGSSNDDSDFEPKSPANKKRRRRIKRSNSSDESGSNDDDDDEKNKNKRKHIRKLIKTKDLDVSTKEAHKEEEHRRKRIEERQKIYNQIFEKPDNVEINELVLDFDEETKTALLQVDKQLLKKLKPHQVAGVKFMWDACFETLKDAEEKPGSGCILAHCMGLGKTMQIVTLSHTLLSNSRRTHVERVLIISPLSTLNNWAREFVHWMGFARKRDIEVYDISRHKDKPTRIFKLHEWYEEGGVCILGYDMYRILANEKAKGLRKKQREQLQEALVDPGPDLVVCDEGHLLKNEKTSISKAVTKMRTKRRIVLTGTPLQNNLKEYYCMIQFIKPNLLGTYKEYMNRFVNPISNGQYTDSTERDIRLMKHRSHILHKMLEGCIQRRDYSVLAPYLPPKHEYVVYTTLSDLQQKLYEYYMVTQRDMSTSDIGGKGARLFQDFQELRRIWTHPMNLRVNSDNVIAKRLQKEDDEGSDMDGFICDESDTNSSSSSSDSDVVSFKSDASGGVGAATSGGGKTKQRRKTRNTNGDGDGDGGSVSDDDVMSNAGSASQKGDPSEWWKRFVDEKDLNNIYHSPKLLILMRLLQQCETIGDKLLVFSQSLQSLDVIEHFLMLVDHNTNGYEYDGEVANCKGFWKSGKDYFRLDGSCSVEQREAMCKKFNDKTNLRARLFLISTRAGGLGINLVAANRVVIFDVSWNPSHDTQSIFRVYRFGQTKPCYIYRLIAMGTMEQKVYERQVAKQATAKRVIDEQQISRHYNQTDLMELYTYELVPSAEREVPVLPKDRLFAELLSEHERQIFKYHEHDSLLEQDENEGLSESERKAAWAEYEAEKTRTVQSSQFISYDRTAFGAGMLGAAVGGQFGNASGSVTSNKIFGFRSDILLQLLNMKIAKDYPDMSQNQVIQLVPTYLQSLYTQMNNGDPTLYKDLLQLHSTIVHPSGMYMNPLLYANQNPSAAGYFQGGTAAPAGGAVPQPPNNGGPIPTGPGFATDEVYEID